MTQLDLLRQRPERFAKEDISSQQFDQIANCAEKEQLEELEEQALKVLGDGNFDIRVIAYYFYAHFLKFGLKSLTETLPLFTELVEDQFEILRPLHRKEKQIENSFNWFFVHVLDKLKYHERLLKEKKSSSFMELSGEEFTALLQTAGSFFDYFDKKWVQSATKERIAHVIKQIEDLKPIVLLQESVSEEEVAVIEPPTLPEISLPPEPSPSSEVFDSIPMKGLMEKLKAFEALTQQGDFLKAALVSSDMAEMIAHFDPCLYFPKLFATYFKLLAEHADSIAAATESRDTLKWKALERLYKIDIEQFNHWNG
jgi:hypothetical protein